MSLRWIWWVVVVHVVLVASVSAAPRRVLVLPLDGNADGALRGHLNTSVQKLAKGASAGATVSVGDATFEETAAAVGCLPAEPKCAASVRTTLGVDELIYGTATTDPSGQTTIVIRRSSATANPPTESTVSISNSDPPEKAESELAPVFGQTGTVVQDTPPPPPPDPNPPPPPGPPVDHTQRNIGIACATGGGVILLIGLGLWANASSKQDQIDNAPTGTVQQLLALRDLEDRAQNYAIVGDILVLGGLALGGYGGWVLYKDHKEQQSVVVTPAVTPTGPAVTIGGTW